MITCAQKFGLFADVEVIFEILRVALVVERIDPFLHKLGKTVGCNLVFYLNSAVLKHFTASIRREEYEGKVLDLEGVVIVGVARQIILIIAKLGDYYHIVADKREEYHTVIFADALCFGYSFLPVTFIMKMIQRTKKKHYVKGIIPICRQINRVSLNEIDFVLLSYFCAEGFNIRVS